MDEYILIVLTTVTFSSKRVLFTKKQIDVLISKGFFRDSTKYIVCCSQQTQQQYTSELYQYSPYGSKGHVLLHLKQKLKVQCSLCFAHEYLIM